MGTMKEVCQNLDETLDEFFSIHQDLLSEQYQLEKRLKEAFFLMSKARYTMGVKSVSSLQYNESDLVKAEINVCVAESGSFTLVDKSKETAEGGEANQSEVGLRKRDVNKNGIQKSSIDEHVQSEEPDRLQKNPLNWFGILVPQSLKQCQKHFKAVPDIVCAIATLKVQYCECLKRYHELLKQKQHLLNDSFEKLEIES